MPDIAPPTEAVAHEHEVLTNPDRLLRLRKTALLDAPTEEAFDRLTRFASKLLQAPLSTVTLVDDERQFYMSCTGFPEPLATTRQT
ncbi:MAG: ATPase, partial [Gemmatimonadaceae bacterium]|nr:ATPase [Gemmatimonadaceae bacterium]